MFTSEENDKIIKEELEAIKAEIISIYNASGKRTTGEFEKGLKIEYSPNKAVLSGYAYLAGRKAGKMPPVQAIEKWVINKGIKPIEAKMKTSSLAFLIARKIAQQGTKKENHLLIYDQLITPERIDKILQRLNQINVTAFIGEVTVMITKLVTNL
ncbi:hypothetical protein OX284_004965 [Flavobacterium sp. SUN046]|uniref:hypothetical protein n=1 Tax=Flavobacterium sp. SUN046 TaxID=3002440 RepID=UPI002DBD185A|nr:hypothetical protein [Flavobacterium sp. SUN046]MEC4048772.1 hypothetical protein [Flavobacterium sp. SUN046]